MAKGVVGLLGPLRLLGRMGNELSSVMGGSFRSAFRILNSIHPFPDSGGPPLFIIELQTEKVACSKRVSGNIFGLSWRCWLAG